MNRTFTKRLKLTGKFLPPILISCCVAMLAGAFAVTKVVKTASQQQSSIAQRALLTEQESARDSVTSALYAKSDMIGFFMARTAPDLISAFDFVSLKSYQEDASRDKDIAYAAYLKPEGGVLTEYHIPEDAANIVEKKYPIVYEGEILGYVLLGISTDSVEKGIAESTSRINKAIEEVGERGEAAVGSFITLTAIQALAVLMVISGIILAMFRTSVINPTNETIELIKQLSEGKGDLTIRLPTRNQDEISELRRSVNDFVQQLRSMIAAIVTQVGELTREADGVRQCGVELAGNADSQQMETVQAAAAMNQMAATVQEVARSTTAAADAATNADRQAREGTAIVQLTTQAIGELASQVESTAQLMQTLAQDSLAIGAVLDVIKSIAEQTNLLALNAAIEAARAGEQGRGFAVVADEVRTLASRTQQSTREIQAMIERLQSGATNAVSSMEIGREQARQGVERVRQTGEALRTISETVALIHEMNTQIAAASEEQAKVADEINGNIASIKEASDRTATGAARTGESSENLSNVASQLDKLVGQFVIN